ncbi:AraC family transcriptional regulator [Vibrio sp. OCN044]|uniref:AraC family transcriptional regulator n=1 Tax=Vibrio tetraodonis subsp. pristinus TaxID=2695891 RepID=A0A6L8LQM4_9VIBR|nr:GyrI-like domain-containing protein [Vibrio tetraodonis]MYM58308.1 AraC family transcriptional regulator [Vibrio tetraodonis subsp. pristinus]
MDIRHHEGFSVTGFTVRTCNLSEQEASTAKIASLWQHFYQQASAHLEAQSSVYGVYSNYESGVSGKYDLTVGATRMSPDCLNGQVELAVPAGKYLVFSAKGEMPATVINLWQEIWTYFADSDCLQKRAYSYDYERYLDDSSVEICIAID